MIVSEELTSLNLFQLFLLLLTAHLHMLHHLYLQIYIFQFQTLKPEIVLFVLFLRLMFTLQGVVGLLWNKGLCVHRWYCMNCFGIPYP